jgi:coenzyme F420-reducing hydrogenase delta subunit/Pyruvate/2-oxoacid:ferredoxin oxidoreductase delta subunit
VSLLLSFQQGGLAALQRAEHLFDAAFGTRANPLRHLGALGFYFLWIVAVSGIYLYAVLDTSIEGIHASITYHTHEQWYLGGLLRSLHRYGADALVVVMVVHLAREFFYGRWHGFRWFSWVTGVPVIWLVYASGIGGYWIVWDQLAQFSAIAAAEWFDWLPLFDDTVARNFLTPASITDRFFSLLVFLHIGIPLLLLLALWVHIQRIARPAVHPARPLALGTLAMLIILSLALPTTSHPPADLARVPQVLGLDWYYLFLHPLMYATSPGALWALAGGLTLALFLVPLLPHPRPQPVAVVDPPNCNGCGRCFADCPYAAVVMEAHPAKPGHQLARVIPELCASCGICAGACPSSTPFRSVEELVTGIDMPQLPMAVLRRELERKLAALTACPKIIVFGCDRAAQVARLEDGATAVMSLLCAGMLPPSFIEYALRSGADGVLVTGCRDGSCLYRLGSRWTEERLAGRREPHLRRTVSHERLRLVWADPQDQAFLTAAVTEFRTHLQTLLGADRRPRPYSRRIARHG